MRPDIERIFLKRSADIYSGMSKRARKEYRQAAGLAFTLADFRQWLRARFDGDGAARCEYSGRVITVEEFTVDHRTPISRGGSFGFDNLAICSESENLRKGNMTEGEYRQFKDFVNAMHFAAAESIWSRLQVGGVQRYAHYRRQRKAVAK